MGGKHCIKVCTIAYKEIYLLPTALTKFVSAVGDNAKKNTPPNLGFFGAVAYSAYKL
jgi:hypothetical protein